MKALANLWDALVFTVIPATFIGIGLGVAAAVAMAVYRLLT